MEKPPLHPKKVQEFEEAYISSNLGDAKLEELRDKTTVAIDPGMSDLLYTKRFFAMDLSSVKLAHGYGTGIRMVQSTS
jgi:hypothetical protein